MYNFCTFFDSNFLTRGLTLYQSLVNECNEFTLWILCLDQASYQFFIDSELPYINPVSLDELEQSSPDLAAVKSNRSLIEYYFTCTASFTSHVMHDNSQVNLLTYLDADLYFFSDPAPIYKELEDHSVGIIDHRFPDTMQKLNRYGMYNVGWVSFRRDPTGLACLEQWRSQCIDWCYDRLEGDRFADQKYLDSWTTDFDRVCVIQHKGANLAPWNVARYRIRWENSQVTVDHIPLIFYHFHGLKRLKPFNIYSTSLGDSRAVLTRVLRIRVYRHYLQAQFQTQRQLLQSAAKKLDHDGVRDFVNSLWGHQWLRVLSRIAVAAYSLLICRSYMYFKGS